MKNITGLFLALGLLFPKGVLAWGAAGHEIVAAEAYRELSPEFKAQVFAVLQAHPDYAKWAAAYHPDAALDLPAYIFLRASTWPDEIRRTGNQYDHPNWHFIDYPLRPMAFSLEPDARPTDNVLFGIAESEKTLGNTNATVEARAVALSWLIHLIGDEHQPLHCESLYTASYPHGDKGGNDFYVKPANRALGLHGIWDGLLGSSANPRTQWNYAIELQTKMGRAALPELKMHTTPKEWSLESRALAIDKGYLQGELKGSPSRAEAPSLPEGYTKAAKVVAEHQAALAGYRLADEVQKYLMSTGPVVPLPIQTNVVVKAALPKVIGAADASKYYNESMVVTGKVVQVTVRPTVVFLNLDQPFPNSPLAAVIFPDHVAQFGDLQKLKHQAVEISGTITEFHNKPEIILESPTQLKVVAGH